MGPIPQEKREEIDAPDILTKAGIAMSAFTPMNIFDQALAQVQSQPPIPPPRQYMTPGMSDFTMGEDGSPVSGAPASVSGASVTGNTAQPLPPPDIVARQGQGVGPQVNQATAQRSNNPIPDPRTRRTDDIGRQRNTIGEY